MTYDRTFNTHTPEFLYVGGDPRVPVDPIHHTVFLYELRAALQDLRDWSLTTEMSFHQCHGSVQTFHEFLLPYHLGQSWGDARRGRSRTLALSGYPSVSASVWWVWTSWRCAGNPSACRVSWTLPEGGDRELIRDRSLYISSHCSPLWCLKRSFKPNVNL